MNSVTGTDMHHRKYMSRDHHPQLGDVTAGTENTASSIVAYWTLFTELLPGNGLIKSVKLSYLYKLLITNTQLHLSFCHLFLQFHLHYVHLNTISLIAWKRLYYLYSGRSVTRNILQPKTVSPIPSLQAGGLLPFCCLSSIFPSAFCICITHKNIKDEM
jgi:hypothetical protein